MKTDMYHFCWANRQEWYYPFYNTLLVPSFTVAWFLNCGVALCAAGRVALQYTIWYIHTFWDKISNLVIISCYMWYYGVIIYKNKYTKRYIKSNILQYKARQIDTKFPKNRKKVWNGEFQIQNSINQDNEKTSSTSHWDRDYQIWYRQPGTGVSKAPNQPV